MSESTEVFGKQEIKRVFREEVQKAGGITAWARKNGVSLSYASEAYNGNDEPGPLIYSRLGFMKVERWIRVGAKVKEKADA